MNLISNIIAGLIVFVLGASASRLLVWLRTEWRTRKLWAVWKFGPGQILLCHSLFSAPESELEPTIGYADAIALNHVYDRLTARYPSKLEITAEHERLDRSSNLVLIGGPLGNPVTRDFCHALQPPLWFFDLDTQARAIRSKDHSIEYRPTVQDGNVLSDVGVFISASNPNNRERRVCVLAGNYGAGVRGVSTFFTSINSINSLHVDTTKDFLVVVKVNVRGFMVSEGEILYASNFVHQCNGW